MIAFDVDGVRFNYRVGGACIVDGHVLLNRADFEDFWYLPGGRGEVLETSRETLVRELQEEMQIEVEVGELLWIVENFFQYRDRDFHELGLIYRFTLASDCSILDRDHEHRRIEDNGVEVIYRWFPIKELSQVRLYPTFLQRGLANLPSTPVHMVERTEAI
jgi:8-oxo-dGTP pyrophosphatase MutT (NUDIX family)